MCVLNTSIGLIVSFHLLIVQTYTLCMLIV
jgi:hypothetical protein